MCVCECGITIPFSAENRRMEKRRKRSRETEKGTRMGLERKMEEIFGARSFSSAPHSDNNNRTWSEIKENITKGLSSFIWEKISLVMNMHSSSYTKYLLIFNGLSSFALQMEVKRFRPYGPLSLSSPQFSTMEFSFEGK